MTGGPGPSGMSPRRDGADAGPAAPGAARPGPLNDMALIDVDRAWAVYLQRGLREAWPHAPKATHVQAWEVEFLTLPYADVLELSHAPFELRPLDEDELGGGGSAAVATVARTTVRKLRLLAVPLILIGLLSGTAWWAAGQVTLAVFWGLAIILPGLLFLVLSAVSERERRRLAATGADRAAEEGE